MQYKLKDIASIVLYNGKASTKEVCAFQANDVQLVPIIQSSTRKCTGAMPQLTSTNEGGQNRTIHPTAHPKRSRLG